MKHSTIIGKGGLATLALICVVVLATLLAGCTGEQTTSTPQSQMISVTGSTTVLPVAQQAAEAFMDTHSYADIQVSGGGSSVGITAVAEGTAEIGMASRDLKSSEKEKYPDLQEIPIAIDGIAIIVNPANQVSGITLAQLKSIYQGNITNWNELGGADQQIVVVGRDSASGTREYFHESVMQKEDFVSSQLEKNSNGAVRQTIAQTPGAIGYVGIGYIDATVKALAIDVNGEIQPTIENVRDGKYPLSRNLNLLTNGPATGLAKEYLDFLKSADGQAIVEKEGFVRIS